MSIMSIMDARGIDEAKAHDDSRSSLDVVSVHIEPVTFPTAKSAYEKLDDKLKDILSGQKGAS